MIYKTIHGISFQIDKSDLNLVKQYRWTVMRGGGNHGAHPQIRTSTNYIYNGKKKTLILTHLLLGPIEIGFNVDHINGDSFDNRRSNLRVCTVYQNSLNKKTHKSNKLGFKGVSKHKNRFRVRIYFQKRVIRGGSFLTVEEAALKYNELAKQYHGVYARLNEITCAKEPS